MTRNSKTMLATAGAVALLASAAWAQFNGGGGPNPFGNGTPNPPGDNPFGGAPRPPATNPFTPQRLPFASGTVSAVDTANGVITLTPMFGQGVPQTVKVTPETQITAQNQAAVSNLKVGERIQVRGVPTGITASQISDTEDGAGQSFGPLDERVNGFGPRSGALAQRANGPLMGMGGPASAQATGKVTSLSPLILAVSADIQIVLKTAPDLKITQTIPEKIGDLKVGDRIVANGQPGDDGALTASRIRVNGFGPRNLPQ